MRRNLSFLVLPALLLLAVLAVVPVLGAFWQSLFHERTGEPARWAGLGNYARFFRDEEARAALSFTLFFVGASVTLEVLAGLAIALVLSARFRGRGLVRAAVLVPWAIPAVVASWIWRYVFDDYSGILTVLSGTSWLSDPVWSKVAIILGDVWKTAPFSALLLLAGLQEIPEELYEAARVDGASAWRRFTQVTLPLLRPALLVTLLFRTIDAFRVFDFVFVLTQGKLGTSVLQFLGYKAYFDQGDLGYGTAISTLVFGMVALVAVFYIKVVQTRLLEGSS
jgi:trehalose/maltose transport system permease protein